MTDCLRIFLLRLKNPSPYIIWDGTSIKEYHTTEGHDWAVLTDGLISVQNLRRDCINAGGEPIVIFSCKRGMPSYEVNSPSTGWGGLFTQSMTKVMYSGIKIKELIRLTNIEMEKSGLNQICEVICRLNLLNQKYLKPNLKGKKLQVMVFDMCRTPGDWGLEIHNK